MKKYNKLLGLALLVALAAPNCALADSQDYTGGINELRSAINGSETTRNFYQNTDIILSSGLGSMNTAIPISVLNAFGSGPVIDGNGFSGITVSKTGQTFNINSPTSTNSIQTTFQNFNSSGSGSVINNNGKDNPTFITDVLFKNNTASGNGGVISNTGGENIIFTNTSFVGNASTSGLGGAIYSLGGGSFVFNGSSSFANNTARSNGGAICVGGATNTTFGGNVSFSGNTSTMGSGGAIFSSAGVKFEFDDTASFTNNTAKVNGGALNGGGGFPLIFNGSTLFSGNTATTGSGGAIFNPGGGYITFNDISSFINNTAGDSGGVLYTFGGTPMTFAKNTSFSGNTAQAGSGGAMFSNGGGSYKFEDTSSFTSNTAGVNGGVIYSGGGEAMTFGKDTLFSENTATSGSGGAIYVGGGAQITFNGQASFLGNTAKNGSGGSIYSSSGSQYTFNDTSSFTNNVAGVSGGVICSGSGELMTFEKSTSFSGNKALTGSGGAVYNGGGGSFEFNDTSSFSNNTAGNNGGAISTSGGTPFNFAKSTSFSGNIAENGSGGAIYSGSGGNSYTFSGASSFTNNAAGVDGGAIRSGNGEGINFQGNTLFSGNNAITGSGGAISNNIGGALNCLAGSSFSNNTAGADGGAIYTDGSGTLQFSGASSFSNNTAGNNGGAIYSNDKEQMNFADTTFVGNKATTGSGGAIFANKSVIMTMTDTSFSGNTAQNGLGGAIFTNSDSTINVIADKKDSVFTGNKDSSGYNDIYLSAGSQMNVNVSQGHSVVFGDKIAAENLTSNIINVNNTGVKESDGITDAPTNGIVAFNDSVSNATVNLYGGTMVLGKDSALSGDILNINNNSTINMINGSVGNTNLDTLSIAAGKTVQLGIDVNVANRTADKITATNTILGAGSGINIASVKLLNDNSVGRGTYVNVVDSSLLGQVNSSVTSATGSIFKYNVSFDPTSGTMGFSAPSGGDYTSYSPSVLSKTISSLTGTYLNQVNVYNEALGRADVFMSLPQVDRLLMRYQNKYAYAGDDMVFSPTFLPEQGGGLWFKQYTSFENIPLNNGPNVSNVSYGSLIGGDTPLTHLKHGYDGYLTAYVGYNGSHQNYDNVGIYQNGGVLGLTGTLYKGNFFTALTANVGATNGNATNIFGVDNFTTLLAGLAWKSGYNIEMLKGKLILQPSFSAAYTFANTYDYTTASGVDITSNPLNAIQLAPGFKLIGNLKNGWQPYLALNMVWNIMDSQKFYANNVALPEMSIAPYVEYGPGIQRRWGDRFTGFGQALARGGGRNGLALQFGFRIALGK